MLNRLSLQDVISCESKYCLHGAKTKKILDIYSTGKWTTKILASVLIAFIKRKLLISNYLGI